jgi:hypothetical protein
MKKGSQFLFSALAALVLASSLNSCKPEDDADTGQETITTLVVSIKNNATNAVTTATFRDSNGSEAGGVTQFDSIALATASSYDVSLLLLDETKSPADTISKEILEEADAHQFYFSSNPNGLATFEIKDKDSKNLPVGLLSTWTTTGAYANGSLTIKLKHKPGQKAENDLDTKGETDIEVTFPAKVQ